MGEAGVINNNALIYLDIRFWSIPAVFIRDIFIGYLIGIKKVSYAMRIIISINLLNIILDYLFVFVLSMNIDGVAYVDSIAMPTTTVTDILDEDNIVKQTTVNVMQNLANKVHLKITLPCNVDKPNHEVLNAFPRDLVKNLDIVVEAV